jgi:hypothetical protein
MEVSFEFGGVRCCFRFIISFKKIASSTSRFASLCVHFGLGGLYMQATYQEWRVRTGAK